MNYSPFLQMLSEDIDSDTLIAMLRKESPKIAKKINQMLLGGFGTSQILQFLQSDGSLQKAKKPKKPATPYEIAQLADYQNKMEVPKDADQQAREDIKKSIPYVMGALGIAAPMLVPEMKMGTELINQILPQSSSPSPEQELIQQPVGMSDFIFKDINIDELPVSKREKLKFIGQAASKLEQQGKTPESPEAEKLKQRVQEILKSKEGVVDEEINRFKGANPEAEITGQEATQMMNQSEDEKLSLSEFARKYKLTLSEANKIRNKQEAETMLQAPVEEQLTEEVIEQPEKPKFMGKGSTVLTKDGELATIEDFPGNTAKISVDGKKKVVKSDDLIELPLPEKDLADLYEDVISGIEKKTGQEVSRNVYLAGYDPNHNELFYKPHDGALYVYDNIPSWAVEELTNLLTKRKTTGSNYIGAWTAGTESPIGAAMSALIRKLQGERGGKGSEYSRKYDIIYDALEPAKQAAREKKKQKEKEEREKQRKEKAKKPRSR